MCTASAATVPLVDGVHASTSPTRLSFTGETMKPENRSLSHPGCPKSHGSSRPFVEAPLRHLLDRPFGGRLVIRRAGQPRTVDVREVVHGPQDVRVLAPLLPDSGVDLVVDRLPPAERRDDEEKSDETGGGGSEHEDSSASTEEVTIVTKCNNAAGRLRSDLRRACCVCPGPVVPLQKSAAAAPTTRSQSRAVSSGPSGPL